jgi:hypothetical protein
MTSLDGVGRRALQTRPLKHGMGPASQYWAWASTRWLEGWRALGQSAVRRQPAASAPRPPGFYWSPPPSHELSNKTVIIGMYYVATRDARHSHQAGCIHSAASSLLLLLHSSGGTSLDAA